MNSFSNKFTRQLSSTANKIREKFVFSSSTKGVLEQPTMIVGHEEVPLVGQHGMVHLEYDIANPPARPERPHSRFVLISDTHNANFDLPDGDVLLHSGDLTNKGTVSDFRLTMDWISNAPHPIKIIIGGNHDISLHQKDGWYDQHYSRWHGQGKQDYSEISDMLRGVTAREKGVVYLESEAYTYQRTTDSKQWSVFGSPWQPEFGGWAFNYKRDGVEDEDIIKGIQPADILLTHGPAYGILDETRHDENVGCEVLQVALQQRLRPKLHVFGHIHEARGAVIKKYKTHETIHVNAANFPSGPKSWSAPGRFITIGGQGWRPIIVDMFEDETPTVAEAQEAKVEPEAPTND